MRTDARVLVLLATLLVALPATGAQFSLWDPTEQEVFALVNLQRGFVGAGTVLADSRLHDAADGHSEAMALTDFFAHTNPFTLSTAGTRVTAAGYNWTNVAENIAAGQGQSQLANPTNAAREVMYGTADLTLLSNFDVSLGKGGFASWGEVGDLWSDADWDAWEFARAGQGGWMGSAGHRGNIRNPVYEDLGVGYFYQMLDQGNVLFPQPPPNPPQFGGPFFTYWTQIFAAGDSVVVPLPPGAALMALPLLALVRRSRG